MDILFKQFFNLTEKLFFLWDDAIKHPEPEDLIKNKPEEYELKQWEEIKQELIKKIIY